MAVPAILAVGLEKRFGDLVAVDGCSFVVQEGEVFGFLGPNGAGKTSTMRMISCVSPKSGGRLDVFGLDVERHPREVKALIGVVSQENNLDPDLSVFDNLVVFARFFEIDRDEAARRAEELIDFFGLREKRNTAIEFLSGGMKRRLTIARALINRPRLVILDEPTTGLDPQARSLIWERLRALRDRGSTVLLSTHYLEEAERFCDRLVIMDRGKILVEGRPDEIVRSCMGLSVIETVETHSVIRFLEREEIGFERFGDLVHITVDVAEPLVQRLVAECNPSRLYVRSSTLEDVFLRLTGRGLKD